MTGTPHAIKTPDLQAVAKAHALAIVEKAYVDQAVLFASAAGNPEGLFSGSLTPLPGPADDHDEFARFDSLVDEGDLDTAIAYLHRFRLRKRTGLLPVWWTPR